MPLQNKFSSLEKLQKLYLIRYKLHLSKLQVNSKIFENAES
jgi:hypothetical protein